MTTDILAAYDEAEPAKRAPWLLVGGAGLLVLGLVGGVTYGVGALSGGGGAQPESALPSGAFAFVKVDLDPSASQKIDGFRFMRQFPALKDKLGGDDLRKTAFETIADGAGWKGLDFESDVSPWMGSQVAVAAYPPPAIGDAASSTAVPGSETDPAGEFSPIPEPDVVVAVEVSDADAARAGLAKIAAAETAGIEPGSAGNGKLGFVVAGDYALLAESQALAERAARDAANSPLAQEGDFSRDLAEAGEGVLTAWVDTQAMTESLGAGAAMGSLGASGLAGGVTGRSTVVARFDGPDVLEFTGQVREDSTAGWATRPVRGLAELPASSVVAVGLADGDELVTRAFESVRKAMASRPADAKAPDFDESVAEAERELGIEIPQDLGILLGDNLVAALDGTESGQFEVGARVSTDVARAEQVLDAITKGSGGDLPLVRRKVGEDLVVASTPAQADRMAAAGTLGDSPAFTKALPDLGEANMAAWVDVAAVAKAVLGFASPEDGGAGASPVDENLAPIKGLGVTYTGGKEGTATFRLRLVTS